MIEKSCARTVLRPFAPARAAACWIYQPTTWLSPSSASPAVLQPALLIIAFTFEETSSISFGPPPPPDLPFFALAIVHFSCLLSAFLFASLALREKTKWQKNAPRGHFMRIYRSSLTTNTSGLGAFDNTGSLRSIFCSTGGSTSDSLNR